MKEIRILFLDDCPWIIPDLTSIGIKFELINRGNFGTLGVYSTSQNELELIKKLTQDGKVDLVVVGNNRGIGLRKAKEVAEQMRSKTIIVWNWYSEEDTVPYAKMGFKLFSSRENLRDLIPQVLNLSEN